MIDDTKRMTVGLLAFKSSQTVVSYHHTIILCENDCNADDGSGKITQMSVLYLYIYIILHLFTLQSFIRESLELTKMSVTVPQTVKCIILYAPTFWSLKTRPV